jgi:hypothetical protein
MGYSACLSTLTYIVCGTGYCRAEEFLRRTATRSVGAEGDADDSAEAAAQRACDDHVDSVLVRSAVKVLACSTHTTLPPLSRANAQRHNAYAKPNTRARARTRACAHKPAHDTRAHGIDTIVCSREHSGGCDLRRHSGHNPQRTMGFGS